MRVIQRQFDWSKINKMATSSGHTDYLHTPLPAGVLKSARECKLMEGGGAGSDYVEAFLSSYVEKKKLDSGLLKGLKNQVFVMSAGKRKRKPPHQKPLRKKITAKEKRKLKLFEIPKDEQNYELYEPLHSLWQQYIEDLLQLKHHAGSNLSTLSTKLTRADLHGSLLTVCRSKCPGYVGITGIVVQETQNTFKLICKDNRVRTVPKGASIFTLTVCGYEFTLYGNHLRFRASERSARKFKDKATIEL